MQSPIGEEGGGGGAGGGKSLETRVTHTGAHCETGRGISGHRKLPQLAAIINRTTPVGTGSVRHQSPPMTPPSTGKFHH